MCLKLWEIFICDIVTVSGRLQLQLRDREPVNHVGRMDTSRRDHASSPAIWSCTASAPAVMTCTHHSREIAVGRSGRIDCQDKKHVVLELTRFECVLIELIVSYHVELLPSRGSYILFMFCVFFCKYIFIKKIVAWIYFLESFFWARTLTTEFIVYRSLQCLDGYNRP